jgi:HTH-type transcriptional regulator / antitoxin HipB
MKLNGQKISGISTLNPSTKYKPKTKLKVFTLEEVTDRVIGKKGTPERDEFEYELTMSRLGYMIREARLKRKLTQEQLGKLVGVQKAQISKLESSTNSATIDTILKVFRALKAKICFNVKMGNQYLRLT